MAIELLGGFRVRVGERIVDEVDWGRRKPKAVVKMLALAPGHRLHRDQLIDALWPELDIVSAASNLRKVVHRARAELAGEDGDGSALIIISQGELLSLPPGTWVDVDAFEQAASEARATRGIDAYRRAIALCRGELLPEDRYEEWAIRRHAELQADALAVLVELAAILEARCELVEAASLLRRAVAMDAGHEEAARGLLRVLGASGQRSEALSVYETLREVLATEIGVDPGIETIELYEEIYSRTEGTHGQTAKHWERIGDLRMMAGDGTGALSALRSALDANESDTERSRLERKSAQAVLLTPTPGPAGAHLDAAESSLVRWPDDPERVRVLATRANWLCQTGAPDAAVVQAEACRASRSGSVVPTTSPRRTRRSPSCATTAGRGVKGCCSRSIASVRRPTMRSWPGCSTSITASASTTSTAMTSSSVSKTTPATCSRSRAASRHAERRRSRGACLERRSCSATASTRPRRA